MAFPVGWPPRPASGVHSIRFFISGTGTANFSDNAWLFSDLPGANPFVPLPYVEAGQETDVKIGDLTGGGSPMGTGQDARDANILAPAGEQAVPHSMIWAQTIRIINDTPGGVPIEFSFDGVNVHGAVTNEEGPVIYRARFEAGISVRGNGLDFRVEAW